jgi:hypothetical protein
MEPFFSLETVQLAGTTSGPVGRRQGDDVIPRPGRGFRI